jgi:hypothetical protein
MSFYSAGTAPSINFTSPELINNFGFGAVGKFRP